MKHIIAHSGPWLYIRVRYLALHKTKPKPGSVDVRDDFCLRHSTTSSACSSVITVQSFTSPIHEVMALPFLVPGKMSFGS